MEAKQICPECGNELIIKDLELFTKRLEESWELLKPLTKNLSEDIQEEIKRKNNIINAKEELKKKGHIRMLCNPCMAIASWSNQLRKK